MGYVLKGNKYRMVDNRSFELPLPVKYELLKEDSTIAEYEISDDQTVSCRIITKYKEEMITPIYRPLDISDIYYFFSCRVFQDKTPFTLTELSLLGLEKYNVYDIIRKTRGVTPFDTYWLRFDGDKCDYETARNAWNNLMSQVGEAAAQSGAAKPDENIPKSDADVNEILHQHKVDVAAKFAAEAQTETAKAVLSEPEPVSNNTMSADEIEALLLKSGLTDIISDEEPAKPELVEEKPASGGMMSQDAIEAMLAAAGAPEPVAEPEPAPVEEKPASGGMMSQDAIEAMLAAAGAPEPVAE
ncbi:MAG: MucR family transcriptional regulator, partial [Ruminococcaceae bacterium]|nr:MucR family transcriptional regulator [Oscillospiraceae bacterium]